MCYGEKRTRLQNNVLGGPIDVRLCVCVSTYIHIYIRIYVHIFIESRGMLAKMLTGVIDHNLVIVGVSSCWCFS